MREKSIRLLPFLQVMTGGVATGMTAAMVAVNAIDHRIATTLVFGALSGLCLAYTIVMAALSVEDPS